MTAAIDWVHTNAGKGEWAHIDASRIGTWGQSCGGLEAYAAGLNDSRVGHLGIFNSGELNEQASEEIAGNLTKPVFYLLGGPSDVAYPNVGKTPCSPSVTQNANHRHRASETTHISLLPRLLGKGITHLATVPHSMSLTAESRALLGVRLCSGFFVGMNRQRHGLLTAAPRLLA